MTGRGKERVVHVRRGQTVMVKAGVGVELEIRKMESGAVFVRNAITGKLLRSWSPAEAKTR